MRIDEENKITDLEECRRKIENILNTFNCEIETDDYHYCWIRDKDTDKTTSIHLPR